MQNEPKEQTVPQRSARVAEIAFLEREAGRVARSMSEFREESLRRLRAPASARPAPPASQRPAAASASRQGASGTGRSTPFGFSPFYYYPFLFASAFPSLPSDALRTIALANRILLEAILLLDKHMDESRAWSPEDLFLNDACYRRSIEILIPLFPTDHPFWTETENLYAEYARAILREQLSHRNRLTPYDEDEFYLIATGKAALIRTNLLAISFLATEGEGVVPLRESQNRFLAGFQAFDDLKDWKEDLRHRNFTYLLTRVIRQGGLEGRCRRGEIPDSREIGQTLYHGNAAEEQLLLAEGYLQGSLDQLRKIPVPLWEDVVSGFLTSCRALRQDLAEIRRREVQRSRKSSTQGANQTETASLASPCRARPVRSSPRRDPLCAIRNGVSYLISSHDAGKGFSPVVSRYPYLNPSSLLAPSPAVATLVRRALEPLKDLDPRLTRLFRRARDGLGSKSADFRAPSLPPALERAFRSAPWNQAQLLRLQQLFATGQSTKDNGLFWANLLVLAARRGLRLPSIEECVCRDLGNARHGEWTLASRLRPHENAPSFVTSRPLVPLLLFTQALGPRILKPDLSRPIQDYLWSRHRMGRTWGNPTNTALSLICLAASGCPGQDLASGAEKLLQYQEDNGSWAPNAVFEHEGQYYGSRDLTSAWCLLALLLHALSRPELESESRKPALTKPLPGVFCQPAVPEKLIPFAKEALGRAIPILSSTGLKELYLGQWESMPAHFLVPAEDGIRVGINLFAPDAAECLSTSLRPLEVEVTAAAVTAARYALRGPLKDRLERLFVAGLGLCLSRHLWPKSHPWNQAGVPMLEWRWCEEHESWLWEELRRFLQHPLPRLACFQWLLPDQVRSPASSIPPCAPLFLGKRVVEESCQGSDFDTAWRALLQAGHKDIVRTFSHKAGLENRPPDWQGVGS